MEYLILFGVWIAFFWRGLSLGVVVDDDSRIIIMKEFHKSKWHGDTLIEKLVSFKNFVWQASYGAGLFKSPWADHLFTLVIHLVNSILILKACNILPAAILYLINPVNNQTALWLNGRRYQLTILCVLLAWNFKPLAFILLPFAAFIHLSGILASALFLTTPWWPIVPIVGIFAGLVGYKKWIGMFNNRKRDFIVGSELQQIKPAKIIIFIKSFGFYFWHTLLPFKPRMWHEFLFYFSRYEKDNKEGYSFNFDFIKGFVAMAIIGYELSRGNFWAFWFLLFISQWCNLYTVTMNVADRYCSLAGIGLMVLLAQCINLLPNPYNIISLTVFITFYILRYQALFLAYRHTDSFYFYHINLEPSGVKQRTNFAIRYIAHNDIHTAFHLIKFGLRYRPQDFEFLVVMAQILFAMGKGNEVLKVLDIAQKRCPLGDEESCKIEFDKIREVVNASTGKAH